MNMNITNIKATAGVIAGSAKTFIKTNSPVILVASGCIGVVAGTILACKATTKLEQINDETNDILRNVHDNRVLLEADSEAEVISDCDLYTRKDFVIDCAKDYSTIMFKYVKLYGASFAVIGLSLTAIVAGLAIESRRLDSALAACAFTERILEEAKERAIAKYGEEEAEKIFNGSHEEIEEKKYIDKNGKEKTKKSKIEVANSDAYSILFTPYTSSACFHNDILNQSFIKLATIDVETKIVQDGGVTLYEVLKSFGFIPYLSKNDPEFLRRSRTIGWIFDPDGKIGKAEGTAFNKFQVKIENDKSYDCDLPKMIFNPDCAVLDKIDDVNKFYTLSERIAARAAQLKGRYAMAPIVIDGEIVA